VRPFLVRTDVPPSSDRSWRYRVVFGDVKVLCWAAQTSPRTPIKPTTLEGCTSLEKKMPERLALILLACVLAFAFAPYFYALGGL
jgi:hypothetical protein